MYIAIVVSCIFEDHVISSIDVAAYNISMYADNQMAYKDHSSLLHECLFY